MRRAALVALALMAGACGGERFRQEVILGVEGEEASLTYNVRPRNYPQR